MISLFEKSVIKNLKFSFVFRILIIEIEFATMKRLSPYSAIKILS